MKTPLLRLVSAVGLALGSMHSSRGYKMPPTITANTPDSDALISGTNPRLVVWLSPFNRAEYRQGKRHRSQKERSNRRKAMR